MPYTVEAVTPADASGLAEAMMNAFWQDPHWKILWTDMTIEQIISDCAERLPWKLMVDRDTFRHLKVFDSDTGKIVGYSRYILPKSHSGLWLDAQTAEASVQGQAEYKQKFISATVDGSIRGMNYAIAAEFGNPLDEVEQGLRAGVGDCLTVDYMTVHPDSQKSGAASLMLQRAIEHADQAGLKAFAMASVKGVRLYQKHGFETIRSLCQDDSKYGLSGEYIHTWVLRQPQPSKWRGPPEELK